MAVTFVASAYATATTGQSSVALTIPTAVGVGDLMVISVTGGPNSAGANPTTPAGWTAGPVSNAIASTGGGTATLYSYYRVAQSSDPGSSLSVGFSTNCFPAVGLCAYSGVVGTLNASATTYANSVSGSNPYPLPAAQVTTNQPCLIVEAWLNDSQAAQTNTALTLPANSRFVDAGYTSEQNMGISDQTQSTSGVGGNVSASQTSSSASYAEITLAFDTASAPSAPTLQSPPNSSSQDTSGGVGFQAIYSSTDGANANAYALRLKQTSASAYSYWNASTSAWQSTEVWNTCSVAPSATFGVSVPPTSTTANGSAYNWSMAFQEAYANLQGPFASDFTFTAAAAPSLTVNSPSGTVVTQTPTVGWTTTPAAGDSQNAYEVIVEHGAYGTTPGSGTQDWNSGVVNSSAQSAQVGVTLANTVTYRAFVQVTETGGITSAWQYITFTVSLDPPAVPTVSAATGTDPATGCPRLVVTVAGRDNALTGNQASMETDTSGWAAGANTRLAVSTQSLDGVQSLYVQATGAGAISATTTPGGTNATPVSPNTQWTVLGNVRAISAAESVTFTVNWLQANGSPSAVRGSDTTPAVTDTTTGWTQAQTTVTSPSDAAFATVTVSIAGATGPIGAPTNPTVATATTGGSIGSGVTRYYKVTAVNAYGQSVGTAEVSVTTGTSTSTNSNTLSWTAVSGAASYDVYASTAAGSEELQATGITATSWTDTAATLATGPAVPTVDTTGEAHCVDEVSLAPGASTTWTRGGLVGSTSVTVTRNDGQQVRGAGWPSGTSEPLPSPFQQGTVYDYEAAPGVSYTYTAVTTATIGNATLASAASTPSNQVSLATGAGWWFLNPTSVTSAFETAVTGYQPSTTEFSAAHKPIGATNLIIVTDTVGGTDATMTLRSLSTATYTALKALAAAQTTVAISSPYGELLYGRLGIQPGGMSSGMGNRTRQGTLNPSAASNPVVDVTVTFVAQPRP